MIADARLHCRSYAESLMNPAKVVVHVVQRNRCYVVLNLFAERVREARETAHRHTHREILALYVAGGNQFLIGIADALLFLATQAGRRTVATFRFVSGIVAVDLLD